MDCSLRDGVILGKLLHGLDPQLELIGFNWKVKSKKPALANLELVLGAVWRKGALCRAMPTAEEMFEGKRDRVFSLLQVIMEVYLLRSMRRRNKDLLQAITDSLCFFLQILSVIFRLTAISTVDASCLRAIPNLSASACE